MNKLWCSFFSDKTTNSSKSSPSPPPSFKKSSLLTEFLSQLLLTFIKREKLLLESEGVTLCEHFNLSDNNTVRDNELTSSSAVSSSVSSSLPSNFLIMNPSGIASTVSRCCHRRFAHPAASLFEAADQLLLSQRFSLERTKNSETDVNENTLLAPQDKTQNTIENNYFPSNSVNPGSSIDNKLTQTQPLASDHDKFRTASLEDSTRGWVPLPIFLEYLSLSNFSPKLLCFLT